MFGSTLPSCLGQPSDTGGWSYADAQGHTSRLTGATFEVEPRTGGRSYSLRRRNRLGNSVVLKKGFRSRASAEAYGQALASGRVFVIEPRVGGGGFYYWNKEKPGVTHTAETRAKALAAIRGLCRGEPVIETRTAAGV